MIDSTCMQESALARFNKKLDNVLSAIENPIQVLGLIVATLMICYQCFARYLMTKIGIIWDTAACEEIALFCYIGATYLALPWATRTRSNIRITALCDQLPERWKKVLWLFNELMFFSFCVFMVWLTGTLVLDNFEFPKYTPALEIWYAFPYMLLPLGFILTGIRLAQNIAEEMSDAGFVNSLIALAALAVAIIPLVVEYEDDISMITVLVVLLLLLLIIGLPIAIALGVSTISAILVAGTIPVGTVAQTAFVALDNVPLLGVFFFVTAGMFMGAGGLSQHLINVAEKLVGHIPGGLALATVVACMFFAAICGSGPATVAAIGSITVPTMIKRGYHKGFAAALVAAAGSIGILIPPSNPFVMYGVLAQVSIGKLFMAGIVPGVLLGACLMAYSYYLAKKNDWKGSQERFVMSEFLKASWEAKWALMVPVIILGGIYCGIMTPTESAAVATLYGLFVGVFVYKGITKETFVKIAAECCSTASIVLVLVALASIFGYVLAIERIPNAIAAYLITLTQSKYVFLLLMIVLLIFVGMFMEPASATIILTPILVPVCIKMGIDPLHFGVVIVFGTALGFVTPPVGNNLFVASAITGLKVESIAKAAIPMILIMLALFFLVTYVPQISLFLTWGM